MKNGKFTKDELEYFESLDAVERAYDTHLIYSDKFKREFIRRYNTGEKPTVIFKEAGLPARLIGYKRIERATWRWKEAERQDRLEPAATPTPCDNTRARRTVGKQQALRQRDRNRYEQRIRELQAEIARLKQCGQAA